MFHLNMIDFGVFKLQASMYIVQWPVTLAMLTFNVFVKLMKMQVGERAGMEKEENELIDKCKK